MFIKKLIHKITIATTLLALFNSSAFAKKNSFQYPNLILKRTEFRKLKNWDKDRYDLAVNAFVKSCDKLALLPDEKKIGAIIDSIQVQDMRDVCELAQVINGMNNKHAKKFFEDWFVPFEIRNGKNKNTGLFTGYYEIELYGRKEKDEVYKYPIYGKPFDLTKEPYFTRAQIMNEGALRDKDLEIFYVDDKVDLFFLHVQGSGRIVLENNVITRVGFAGRNNHPYTSIGKIMLKKDLIEEDDMSAGSIKEWLRNNPLEADQLMAENKSFIFFKELEDGYIRGAQGAVLTPERSLAVDDSFIPYGFPIWLETTLPLGRKGKVPYNRLMVSQDTGSAIKGAVRGDVFFGFGERAEELASYMQQKGKYYIFLPLNVVEKLEKMK